MVESKENGCCSKKSKVNPAVNHLLVSPETIAVGKCQYRSDSKAATSPNLPIVSRQSLMIFTIVTMQQKTMQCHVISCNTSLHGKVSPPFARTWIIFLRMKWRWRAKPMFYKEAFQHLLQEHLWFSFSKVSLILWNMSGGQNWTNEN